MTEFFLSVVNRSISAGWIVLGVLLLRSLLRKAPKWITVLLWGVVALRLVCPFTIESAMSLIPSAQTISPGIMMERNPSVNSGIPIINSVINPIIVKSFAPDPATSANPLQLLIPILSVFWVAGIVGMLLYTAVSYLRLKKKIGTAVRLRDNLFQSENVASPFVLGMVKPRIYLPFGLNEQDMSHVIAHEQAHIRRKDHWWKPLGFALLALHWFNPLIWLGYVLLCRDIELACDEKVIKGLGDGQKADYSQALLTCSVNRSRIAACPLAFGEVGVKNRVKSVLNYRKPAVWIIVMAIAASAVAAVCFLTDPISDAGGVKLMDPVYPPYYEQVYQELFCADLETVCEKLGYTSDQLTLIMDENNSPLCYRTNETVSYLGRDFQMEFWFADTENERGLQGLTSVQAYAPLTGSAEDNALVVEELGETLQKMFGYTPVGEYAQWDGFHDLDPAELAQKLSGEEGWYWGMVWQLTDDVEHIPVSYLGINGSKMGAVNLTYTVSYSPEESAWVRIQYGPGVKTGDHLVREKE